MSGAKKGNSMNATEKRDPRVDPQPSDRFLATGDELYVVSRTDGKFVSTWGPGLEAGDPWGFERVTSLEFFRQVFASARVLDQVEAL